MATRRAKQLYFTRHDNDLWEAIQSIPDGEQNHEIRKALRHWFLGENDRNHRVAAQPTPMARPTATEEPTMTEIEPEPIKRTEAQDADEAMSAAKLDLSQFIL